MRTALIISALLALPSTADARPRPRKAFQRQLRLVKAQNNSYPVRDVLVAYAPTFKILKWVIGGF